jgi:hypothetical protein
MPLPPAAVTTTGSSWLAARSSASIRSLEAELSMGFPAIPWQASMPASRISWLEESNRRLHDVAQCETDASSRD